MPSGFQLANDLPTNSAPNAQHQYLDAQHRNRRLGPLLGGFWALVAAPACWRSDDSAFRSMREGSRKLPHLFSSLVLRACYWNGVLPLVAAFDCWRSGGRGRPFWFVQNGGNPCSSTRNGCKLGRRHDRYNKKYRQVITLPTGRRRAMSARTRRQEEGRWRLNRIP
jgi:hypothetical protein